MRLISAKYCLRKRPISAKYCLRKRPISAKYCLRKLCISTSVLDGCKVEVVTGWDVADVACDDTGGCIEELVWGGIDGGVA
jgi:hypothetical protein